MPSNAPTRRPCAGEEPARSEPLVPSSRTTVLREDSHGRLLRLPDRRRAYLLPAERLQGRSPASLYLARAERIATAAVPETEAPEIERRSDGAVLLSWRPWRGRALRIPVARHGAEVPRFVLRVLRAVEILGRLHARGAAHGRLGLDHFRIHARSGRLRIAMALEVGPGQDGDDLAAQQAADIRVVGALLYAAFAGQGGTEGIREILDRAATGELPLLAARRPDLIPGLAVAVDRALRAEPRSLPSLGEFRAFLRRLVEFRAGPAPSGPSVRRLYRGWVGSAAVVLVIAAIAFGQHLIGASHDAGDARLDTGDRITTRLQHIRGLVRAGRIDDASAAYQDLAIELGLPPGTAPVPVTGTAPATSPDGALDDRDRR